MFRIKTTRGRATAVTAATTLIAAGIVGLVQSPAFAAAATYTPAPTYGAGAALGGGTPLTVVLTGKGFKNAAGAQQWEAFAASVTSGIQVATSCGTALGSISGNITNNTTDGVLSVNVPSATRMVVKLGALPLASGAKKDYKICVYTKTSISATNVLLGSASFTAYPAPTVATVTPSSGPLYGGATIAIDGTNFTSKSTVTVGALAATNVKFIDSTSMTATVPAGASAAAAAVKVTNEGGPSTTQNYTYVSTVTVSPSTGLAAGGLTVTIKGAGFNALTFGTSLVTYVGSWIIFQDGNTNYDATDGNGATGGWLPDAPASGYCTNVVVISDTELTCDTPVLTTNKVYAVGLLTSGIGAAGDTLNPTVVNSQAFFTAAPF